MWIAGESFGSGIPLVAGPNGNSHDLVPNGQLDGFIAIIEPIVPVVSFGSFATPGQTALTLSWIPDNGNIGSITGTISCTGATPGGSGQFGISLAPTDFLLPFGFPLLIVNDPLNLVLMGSFGYDFGGALSAPNTSRQDMALAGSVVYIQFFEVSPVFGGSNGLKMLLAP